MGAGASVSATADAKGTWTVVLSAMPASREGRTLTVTGGDGATRMVRDVRADEVWLCSGQKFLFTGCKAALPMHWGLALYCAVCRGAGRVCAGNAERTLNAAFELAGADGVGQKARIVNFPRGA